MINVIRVALWVQILTNRFITRSYFSNKSYMCVYQIQSFTTDYNWTTFCIYFNSDAKKTKSCLKFCNYGSPGWLSQLIVRFWLSS